MEPLSQSETPTSRWYSGKLIQASSCSACAYVGFVAPSEAALAEYYSTHYGKQSKDWYNLAADYEPAKTTSRANDISKIITQYLTSVTDPVTLEVGCAFGGTVHELRRRGVNAFGVDLNSDAIAEGQRHGNAFIHADFAHNVVNNEDAKANLVYAYHALEHIPDVRSFLESLKPCLADHAVLEFRVPNGAYLKAWKRGFQSWDWFAFPDHLHMFTPRSTLCLAEASGFDVLAISSDSCGESLDSIRDWLGTTQSTISDDFLMAILERSMLLQELRMVLCVSGSLTSERFQAEIRATRSLCLDSLRFEKGLKQLAKTQFRRRTRLLPRFMRDW